MKKVLATFAALCGVVAICGAAYADCPDQTGRCKIMSNGSLVQVGTFRVGHCWKDWSCQLCATPASLAKKCNETFPACLTGGGCYFGEDNLTFCTDVNGHQVYCGGEKSY